MILTAVASSGATATQPKRVTVNPPTDPPTPSPSSIVTAIGQTTTGILPINVGRRHGHVRLAHGSTGSTFTLVGNQFTYKAGTTIGTDVVRLTSQGLCGPGVATFTANVVDPGTPVITSFTADPPRGCGGYDERRPRVDDRERPRRHHRRGARAVPVPREQRDRHHDHGLDDRRT